MKIYLAGPDVFRPDALAHGEHLKQLCREHGLTGLYPLDTAIAARLSGPEAATAIYRANIALIQEADILMANLDRFRGHEPDSGTAFEVGYAAALGKPVWAYTCEARSIVQQITNEPEDSTQHYRDENGYTIENFGLNLNLMLACSTTLVIGDVAECLRQIAATHLSSGAQP